MIDILVATKDGIEPRGLEYVPAPWRLLSSDAPGWAAASNALLDESENDVLFLDDDVTITPYTFDLFERYYDAAEVFGFALIQPRGDGWAIASTGHALDKDGNLLPRRDVRDVLTPGYVAHVTTSAIYVKRAVVASGLRFPLWPGVHCEDVAFTYDAWLRGFRVLYLPGIVEHPLSAQNMGYTKTATPNLLRRLAENKACLAAWITEHGVWEAAQAGKIPIGTLPVTPPAQGSRVYLEDVEPLD